MELMLSDDYLLELKERVQRMIDEAERKDNVYKRKQDAASLRPIAQPLSETVSCRP
jgi:hypothetical protein